MIDFHSHILPDIDDGSGDIKTSLRMLKNAYRDGIEAVVSTSHIYIGDENDIDFFLQKRNSVYDALCKAMEADGGKFPQIRLGAEVYVRKHISRYESISRLAIGGTDYILLEMPMHSKGWQAEHYETIYNLTTLGLKPIIAHIDRYMQFRSEFENLKAVGAIFQVNADAFLHKSMRRELLKLYYDGYIHLLGSDMHNLADRKNRLKDAYEIICDKYGMPFADYPMENAKMVLENRSVYETTLPKLGFLDRIKL